MGGWGKGWRLEDMKAGLRKQVEVGLEKKAGHRTADPVANVEQITCRRSLDPQAYPGQDSLCSIHVHSVRKRLADPDGVSGKALLDGLVHCRILGDDTSKQVSEVGFSQEQGKSERTIVTIEWENGAGHGQPTGREVVP